MTTFNENEHQAAIHDCGSEMRDRGWQVIPLSIDTKKPLNLWESLQTEFVPDEEWEDWCESGAPTVNGDRIKNFNLAIVTGVISGLVVLDCDNPEAEEYARRAGLTSPFMVRTTRGCHFYFAHPRGGVRVKNEAGGITHGWPKVRGLDLRGDGGYVVAPPSVKLAKGTLEISHRYMAEVAEGWSWEDIDEWPWPGVPGATPEIDPAAAAGGFDFETMNLSGVRAGTPQDGAPIEEQVETLVARLGRKLSDGDGRNALMTRYLGQCVRRRLLYDEDLEAEARRFMGEHFAEDLHDRELAATLRCVVDMDRRHYPAEYEGGVRVGVSAATPTSEAPPASPMAKVETPSASGATALTPIRMGDVSRLLSVLKERSWLVEPFIAKGEITQIVGYNGSGKSLFAALILAGAGAGATSIGPFKTEPNLRTLYLDFDNPARTALTRMRMFQQMNGDAGENFNLWSPALIRSEDGGHMPLNTNEGFALLGEWCKAVKPDVVVIDTIRNAFPGLEERDAKEWIVVNQVARTIRNETGAAVVMVHHRNKPSGDQLGREAGSTAQLTDLDTQLVLTPIFDDKGVARSKGGLYDGDLTITPASGADTTPWSYLSGRLEPDSRLRTVVQVDWGKVRVIDDLHEVHYLGIAQRLRDGSSYLVSTMSARQKAVWYHGGGMTPNQIATKLGLPSVTIRPWIA